MLTIKTAAHIRTSRHLKSFRAHATSTGFSLGDVDECRRAWETARLAERELRRWWLALCWARHRCQLPDRARISP
jgi:hypothetical protein